MDFGLSQDQQMLRDAVARCLADTCPLDNVRECTERDNPLSDKVLRAVQDLGIPGMLVPEEHGGLGMTLLDAAIVAEQLAYAVAPVPFLASHVLTPIALSEAGSEEQKAHWLPKIASGEARVPRRISPVMFDVGASITNLYRDREEDGSTCKRQRTIYVLALHRVRWCATTPPPCVFSV